MDYTASQWDEIRQLLAQLDEAWYRLDHPRKRRRNPLYWTENRAQWLIELEADR